MTKISLLAIVGSLLMLVFSLHWDLVSGQDQEAYIVDDENDPDKKDYAGEPEWLDESDEEDEEGTFSPNIKRISIFSLNCCFN